VEIHTAPASVSKREPSHASGHETELPRIFVSIASYRDTECQWTVKDLFEKATYPDRVFVGICWQSIPEEDADCFEVSTRPAQCRVIHVDARQSRGVCWARSQVQSLWRGEEYFFQIDAHSRFEPGWDEISIAMLKSCPSPRAVLSSYPTSYVPPNQLGPRNVVVISPKEFDDRGLLAFTSAGTPEEKAPETPTPTHYIGAGLFFAPSEVIREVPYDPYIYFTGEEITLAVRLWTHGWDLFAPNRVTVFHEYSERPNKRRHWHDHKLWHEMSEKAGQRVRYLLEGRECRDASSLIDVGRYGLGKSRSLEEYQNATGVDFKRQTIQGKDSSEIEAGLPSDARTARIGKRFSDLWSSNGWGHPETRSGPGSSLAQTETLRPRLQEVLHGLGVRSLIDAGCGDLNWMQKISADLDLYLGVDIVEDLVLDLRKRFTSRKNHFFNTADVTSDRLPAVDAILCRDVLTHLSLPLVSLALQRFRESGAKFLITTTFPRGHNDPIRTGAWQMIDLNADPFGLPPPLLLINEGLGTTRKSLGVWPLGQI
jgi:Glycosyltransferase (GlcNAc)